MDFDFDTLEKRVEEWVKDPANQAELAATREKARAASEQVLKDMRPDPEIMRQPMTI